MQVIPIKLGNLLKAAKLKLRENGFESFSLEAELLMGKTLNYAREKILLNLEQELTSHEIQEFNSLLERRLSKEPISQILGCKEFWDYKFIVTKDVLTPRPDTETIISEVLNYYPETSKSINILDLGTGSGCLGITLAKLYQNSLVDAIDISASAIEIAKKNAELNICNNIKFYQQSFTEFFEKSDKLYDIIVSNPPYISLDDWENLEKEVKHFEPKLALTDNHNGLSFYSLFANKLKKLCSLNSHVFLEFGINQANAVALLFEKSDWKVAKIVKDLSSIERVIVLSRE